MIELWPIMTDKGRLYVRSIAFNIYDIEDILSRFEVQDQSFIKSEGRWTINAWKKKFGINRIKGQLFQNFFLKVLVETEKRFQLFDRQKNVYKQFNIKKADFFPNIHYTKKDEVIENILNKLISTKGKQELETTILIPANTRKLATTIQQCKVTPSQMDEIKSDVSLSVDFIIVQKAENIQKTEQKQFIDFYFFQMTTQQGSLKQKLNKALMNVNDMLKSDSWKSGKLIVNKFYFFLMRSSTEPIPKSTPSLDLQSFSAFVIKSEKEKRAKKQHLKEVGLTSSQIDAALKQSFVQHIKAGVLDVHQVWIENCKITPNHTNYGSLYQLFVQMRADDKKKRLQSKDKK